jgi:hypothetical protein
MSPQEENQIVQATESLKNFIKIFVKNYPLVFKDGSYAAKINPSNDKSFPYQVSIEIKKK